MREIFKNDELYFVPLGGSEEFGMNLNLYVSDDEYLAVDCGIGFADERFPGIDLLLPDPWLLEDNKTKLAGLVITHAHEDHIGAVAHLYDRLECPIYTCEFTAAVLMRKFDQEGLEDVVIHVVKPRTDIQIGEFTVQFIPVSHSVPDSCSVVVKTRHGNILHSGDWNLDPAPVVGEKTNEADFKALSHDPILAYIGDSTNAQSDGFAGSEADVADGLAKEFEGRTGKIAVTLFASNIGRLISVVRAAEKCGRSVALVGRSLYRMVGAARDCGYLDGLPDFVDMKDLAQIPDDNLVLVLTGSQGEARAALARIARGDSRDISLNKGDSVIFSARAIPGNERSINTVKNNLSAAGVHVITPSDTKNKIHISGHPCREEITQMLQWVQPKCVIPVHGERMQLDAQAALARSCQVNHVIVPNNGSVIRLAPGEPMIVDHVETGVLAVDQRRIIPVTHQSISARRKLQYSGTVHASLILDDDYALLGDIKIDTVGLSCKKYDDCMISDIERAILSALDNCDKEEADDIAEDVRIAINRYVMKEVGFKPKTTVHVMMV